MERQKILEALITNMKKVIEGIDSKDIAESMSLVKDFGTDSLEIVEVVSRTLKDLRVKVPRTKLAEATNIAELIDLFYHQAQAVP